MKTPPLDEPVATFDGYDGDSLAPIFKITGTLNAGDKLYAAPVSAPIASTPELQQIKALALAAVNAQTVSEQGAALAAFENAMARTSPAVVLDLFARIEGNSAKQIKANDEGDYLSMDQVDTIRSTIRVGDGWDGDNWDCAMANAVAAHFARIERAAAPAPCTNSDSWNCKYCSKTASCEALKDERNFGKPAAPPAAASGDELSGVLGERRAFAEWFNGTMYRPDAEEAMCIGWQARAAVSAATKPTNQATIDLMPKRAAFIEWCKARAIDTTEEKDAWGERKFVHPHVESIWTGWFNAPTDAVSRPTAALFTVEQVQTMIAADRAQIAATKPTAGVSSLPPVDVESAIKEVNAAFVAYANGETRSTDDFNAAVDKIRAAVSAATKPTADLSKLIRFALLVFPTGGGYVKPREGGDWVKFEDVQSLLATKPAAAPAVPKGWKLVPVEPTAIMLQNAMANPIWPGMHITAQKAWRNMLAVAPASPMASADAVTETLTRAECDAGFIERIDGDKQGAQGDA